MLLATRWQGSVVWLGPPNTAPILSSVPRMLGGLLMRNRSLSGPGKFARLWASGLGTNRASTPPAPARCRDCSRHNARRLVPDAGRSDVTVGPRAGPLAGGLRVEAVYPTPTAA